MVDVFELIKDVGETAKGAVTSLDDAIKDIGGTVTDAVSDLIGNLTGNIDDILKDIRDKLKKLPEVIIEGVQFMLRDPKFWTGLLLFLGLVVFAEAFAFASQFPAGMRSGAFLERAGVVYHKTGMGFLTKAHRISFIVSPAYREQFAKIIAPQLESMSEAGVDLGTAMILIGDIAGLFRSTSIMLGQDYEASKSSWDTRMTQIGDAVRDHSEEWAENPETFFDWLDTNLVAPEHNKAAGFFNRVSGAMTWVLEKGQKFQDGLDRISGDLKDVSRDLADLGYTEAAENIKEGAVRLGEFMDAEWKAISGRFRELSETLRTRTIQIIETAHKEQDVFNGTLRRDISIIERSIAGYE